MNNAVKLPNNAAEIEKLGDNFLKAHQNEQALECYLQARALNKENAIIYLKLGKAFLRLKNYIEAERALKVLQNTTRVIAEARILYAECALMLGRTEEARKMLDDVLSNKLSDYETYVALQVYLALSSEMGDKEKVIILAGKILKHKPDNYNALTTLLAHKKATEFEDGFLDRYVQIADKTKGLDNRSENLFFALAKAFEQLKDYKKAAKYAKRANAIYGNRHKFDSAHRQDMAEKTMQVFTKKFFVERKELGDHSSQPIFIVGMPRSATSLTEQILASHSKVTGCGELYSMGAFSKIIADKMQSEIKYPQCLNDIRDEHVKDMIAEYYTDITSKGHDIDGKIITDKMPTNFYFLGLIALLFPNAKIINCVRDLRDVGVSNYMQKFNMGNYWAQSFDDIYTMSTLYKKLMAHWKENLPIEIYDFNYESLLQNSEEEIKKLIAHCELDWEDGCLEYHKTERAVQTASMSQVKQPLFKSSLGKWKSYEPFFGKELKKLGELN